MVIAGFGYAFFNDKLRDHNKPVGYDEFSGSIFDIKQPLIRQPGEGWEYGVNIDWAGLVLERATHLSLNDYMQKNIFEPLGLKNISMFPSASMKANLAHMNFRNPDGSLAKFDHIHRKPLIVESKEDIKNTLNSGGAGCFAKPQEYARKSSHLLSKGLGLTVGRNPSNPSQRRNIAKNKSSDPTAQHSRRDVQQPNS